MKKQKKHVKTSIFLMLTAVLLMAGCQKKPEEIPQETPRKEQEVLQEEGLELEQQKEAYVPVVSLETYETESYVEDSDQILVTGSYELPMLVPTVEGEESKALQENLEEWKAEQSRIFQETVDRYEVDAQEYLESMTEFPEPEEFQFYGFSTTTRTEYMRVDTAVLSFRQMYSDYTGGAHGNYGYAGVTFDVASGARLELKDLLREDVEFEAFCDRAAELCIQKAREAYAEGLFENYETSIREGFGETTDWYLDAAGLTIVFDPYEIGPYAMGPAFVTLPYAELAEVLKPEYLGLKGAGSAVLQTGTAAQIEVAEGLQQEVLLLSEIVDEEMWSTRITLKVGEQEEISDGIATVRGARVIRQDSGRVFVIYYVDMASDDYITYVYEITDGELRKTAETEMSSSMDTGYVNPEVLRLGIRIDLMGTYSATVDYQFREDGSLEQLTEIYELQNDSPWAWITTIRELPVVVDGEETLLPAGSRIRVTATDQNGIAWFREDDTGVEGEIHYTRGDDTNSSWPVYIDGVEETEYFEMLPYAG